MASRVNKTRSKIQYDTSNIKVLSEIESIRKNPGKDIGDTSTPIHLLHECLDNALDELAVSGSELRVYIDNERHIYRVIDNGRGIPIGYTTYKNQEILVPILICTKLFSSGKFDRSAYHVPAGLHGVGLVAVNALSKWMELNIYRDGKHLYIRFENAIPVKIESNELQDNNIKQGTDISFEPDPKYFDKVVIDIDQIRTRLQYALLHDDLHHISIYINDEKLPIPKEPPLLSDTIGKNKIYYENKKTGESIIIWFGWAKDNEFNQITLGSVNRIPVHQGTHINYALQCIRQALVNTKSKWSNFPSKNKDIYKGIRVVCLCQIRKIKFLGQTKDRLLTPLKYFNDIFPNNKVTKIIQDQILSNTKIRKEIDAILTRIYNYTHLTRSKLKLSDLSNGSSAVIANDGRKRASRGLADVSVLKDCLSDDVDKCTLYIVEGRSASGPVNEARDPNYHAILLLQGKITNVGRHDNLYRVLTSTKSKELLALIKALGCGIDIRHNHKGKNRSNPSSSNELFDINKLRYGNIVICADADPDGAHIVCLLLTVFLRLFRPIIEANKLWICEAPLYGITDSNKGSFIPIWDKKELDHLLRTKYNNKEEKAEKKSNNKRYHIHRFKGLGEMNADQLHAILFDQKLRRLIPVEIDNNDKDALKIMSSSTSVRYKLLREAGLIR